MRHRGFRQLVMLDVTSDTDDLQRWTIRSRRQSLSESVSAGKESLGQRFVDDHNSGSAFAILVGEAASLGHLYAHRLVIIGTDDTRIERHLFVWQRCTTLNENTAHEATAAERHHESVTNCLDARQRFETRVQMMLKHAATRFEIGRAHV